MKKLFIVFCIFYSSISIANRPSWINSPMDNCSKIREICAVGEGTGVINAEASARDAIARIFKTNVNSNLTSITETKQVLKDDVVTGEESSDFAQRIKLTTEEVIKGVQIKQTYTDQDYVYALASLDKKKVSTIFKEQMDQIDIEIESNYKKGSRSSLSKAEKLYKVRSEIHEKFLIVNNSKYPSKISLKKIHNKKLKKVSLNTTIYVDVNELNDRPLLKNLIIQGLLDNDYRVVTNKKSNYQFIVRGSFKEEKLFFKVKGFEKYQFLLQLYSEKKSGEKLGGLHLTEAQVGRSHRQALSNALPSLKKSLLDRIDELKLD